MDDRTGHLVALAEGQQVPDGYSSIPLELEVAAQVALAGETETHINPTHTGPMPQHLRDQRRMRAKRKARRRQRRRGR